MESAIATNPVKTGMYNGIMPPPILSLSEWAEQHAYLSPESSAEPGKWTAYPYQVGIMDAITDPLIEKITLMKSARIGYTKCLNHAIGYHIDHDPAPMLVVQPTVEDAQGYSKDELSPMLRDTPALYGIVSEPKSRDSDNTILRKAFPGGFLSLVGANSPRGFRRVTVRILLFDEVDGYPPSAGQEGDQLLLAERRTMTFWNRKIVIGSTPLVKGTSRVEASFEMSDQRFFYVPCPFCHWSQVLKWAGIQWPKDEPLKAYYVCENCKEHIPHSKKREMVGRGEWIATQMFSGHAGFRIWAAYSFSPNASWGRLAKEFLDVKSDPLKLRTFINTVLGETWEEEGEGVDDEALIGRVEQYEPTTAPYGVLVITAGVDVQKDRLEMEITGWGLGEESWSIDYVVLTGDPERQDVWDQLDEQLERTFTNADEIELRILCCCIDSGYKTQAVYRYVHPRQVRRVYATKGASEAGKPLVGKPTKRSLLKGLKLYPVGTDTAKDIVYARLKIQDIGAGYCHFPDHYNNEYFEMLTAEKAVIRYHKGTPRREWVQTRTRNEALDARVLSLVALNILNPQLKVIAKKQAQKAEVKKEEMEVKAGLQKKKILKKKPKRKGFVQRW